ncbi:unnamed protein product, partial [Darwinula stevensoni]
RAGGIRACLEGGGGTHPPFLFQPHLNPFFPALKGFPGFCSCCPIRPGSLLTPSTSGSSTSSTTSSTSSSLLPGGEHLGLLNLTKGEERTASLAELRRKAREHSAAIAIADGTAATGGSTVGRPSPVD